MGDEDPHWLSWQSCRAAKLDSMTSRLSDLYNADFGDFDDLLFSFRLSALSSMRTPHWWPENHGESLHSGRHRAPSACAQLALLHRFILLGPPVTVFQHFSTLLPFFFSSSWSWVMGSLGPFGFFAQAAVLQRFDIRCRSACGSCGMFCNRNSPSFLSPCSHIFAQWLLHFKRSAGAFIATKP